MPQQIAEYEPGPHLVDPERVYKIDAGHGYDEIRDGIRVFRRAPVDGLSVKLDAGSVIELSRRKSLWGFTLDGKRINVQAAGVLHPDGPYRWLDLPSAER